MSNPWADFGRQVDESSQVPPGAAPAGSGLTETPYDAVPPSSPARSMFGLRAATAIGGLLAAGSVVLGMVLVIVMVLRPVMNSGADPLDQAAGPGWPRTLVQLGAGIAAEFLLSGGRRSARAGVSLALAVTAALVALAALWWAWWR